MICGYKNRTTAVGQYHLVVALREQAAVRARSKKLFESDAILTAHQQFDSLEPEITSSR
uniref:Transposase n=1 Tax=Heterorhabditis bacteriophora TaxID=37862 RepID=A0A1I7WBT1_HETBA